jgi:tyrosine-protein kinase Etk/Wzc
MTEPSNLRDNELPGDGDEVKLIDLLLVIAENARLLIFGPLVVGLAALAYSYTITPSFTATATILPPQQQSSTLAMLASQLGGLAGIAGLGGSGPKSPADLYVALINSRDVADRMVDRFKLMQLYGVKLRVEARSILAGATKVTAGLKDGLITIEVKDHDPKRSADMANAYVEELERLTDGLAITEAQQRRIFFEKQVQAVRKNLEKAQLALGEVGVGESVIKSSPEAVLANIAGLRAQVTVQEIKLSTMRSYLTEQSPEFQLAQRQLASLRAQLAQADHAQPGDGTKRDEYINRFRDFKYQETLFELLAKQLESARLDEAREGSIVQVVDVAVPPESRSSPRRTLIAVITTLAAGMFLLLAVFAREGLRRARNNPESASKLARIASAVRGLVPGTRK